MLNRLLLAACRAYPLKTGHGRIANSAPLRWAAGRTGPLEWTRVVTGQEILVPTDDYVGRAIYYFGDLDPYVTWALRRVLRPGDTVLDIGANLGLTTLISAHLVGGEGRIHAFEPQPQVASLLRKTIVANGLPNVTVHPHALGAKPGRATLTIPQHNAGAATLLAGSRSGVSIEVEVRTLSQVVRESISDPVRLLKIDVEGFEVDVLEGARELFQKSPPDAVLVEVGASISQRHQIRALLHELGYRLTDLPRCPFRIRPRNVRSATEPVVGHDLLALHRGTESIGL